MKNPRFKSLTPEQEEILAKGERMHIRADIFVAGVAAQLKDSMYAGAHQLEECARILNDAARMHSEGYALQDKATSGDRHGYRAAAARTGSKRKRGK